MFIEIGACKGCLLSGSLKRHSYFYINKSLIIAMVLGNTSGRIRISPSPMCTHLGNVTLLILASVPNISLRIFSRASVLYAKPSRSVEKTSSLNLKYNCLSCVRDSLPVWKASHWTRHHTIYDEMTSYFMMREMTSCLMMR